MSNFAGMGKPGFVRTYDSMSFKTLYLERLNEIKSLNIGEIVYSSELCFS